MSQNFFSVIIPTYNRSSLLVKCLESLCAQTFKSFEVIVCDDGSTDNTSTVVESFKNKLDIRYFWNENWGGPARPRNVGIQNSKSDWICFLDSDDWWYPKKLEEIYPFTAISDVIYHDLQAFSPDGIGVVISGRTLSSPAFIDLLSKQNALPNSSVCVKKALLEMINGFTERRDFIAIEDYDAWIRIAAISDRFTYLPKILGGYWISNTCNNISFSSDMFSKEISLLRHHLENLPHRQAQSISHSHYFYLARRAHLQADFRQARQFYRASFRILNPIRTIKSFVLFIFSLFSIIR